MALRGLALAVAACSLGQVMAEDPPCAIFGKGYNDPKRNSTPTGGEANSSKLCQELCANTAYCDRFTYYNDSKGCWLQGVHEDRIIESPFAISGPVRCPEFVVDDSGSGDGGFPWWILLLVLAAMLACAALAYYLMGDSSGKKKKKEKKTSKSQGTASPDVEERAALVAASDVAPAPAAAPLQAASVYYAPPAQAAVPATYSVVVAPPQLVVAPPQYVYQQTASRQVMMPVAQPAQVAVHPDDLFNRFDADGDGRLSREELEAGMASMQQQ